MNEESFVEKKRDNWLKLLELSDRADRSPTDLTEEQLLGLMRLYRTVSSDLAFARTVSTSPSLIRYLNDLTAKAYAVVYRQPRQPFGAILYSCVSQSAQTVRRRSPFVLASAILFFGSTIAVFFLCRASPTLHAYFVPEQFAPLFDQWKSGKFEERSGSQSAGMWTMYASHNPTVSIITGAVGAGSFGILSVLMILQNGSMLGSLANEMVPVHRLDFLLSSILPHGVPEMSGLVFSGASGLLLGWALINPGQFTRGESLKAVGKDAITLLATSVVMMFFAAPIEGFFSFNPHVPGWLKTAVGLTTLAIWLRFWSGFAKEPATVPPRAKA